MTSLPAFLRLSGAGRSLVGASVAGLTSALALSVAAGGGPSPPQDDLVRDHPPSAPAPAAMTQSGAGSVDDIRAGAVGVAPRSFEPGQGDGSGGAMTSARARWQWPLQPRPPVVRPFRAPLTTYGPGHRGLDLGAALDAPVRAVEAGVVTHAGMVAGRSTVTVTHADDLRSTYEPVTPTVVRGQRVVGGEVLGALDAGIGHCGGRECLHLGAGRGAAYLDPIPLLVAGRLALLPVGPVR